MSCFNIQIKQLILSRPYKALIAKINKPLKESVYHLTCLLGVFRAAMGQNYV